MTVDSKAPPSATVIRFPKAKHLPNTVVEGSIQGAVGDHVLQAVHYYVSAQRALGRRLISPELVALGLQLPMQTVLNAFRTLHHRKG